jgi:signal transduction histidine kinase
VQRGLSIEWRLPLLITAVLAAGLAAFLAFTYVTLAKRSETVVRDRFEHASKIVAGQVSATIMQRKASFDSATRDSAILRFVIASRAGTATRRDSVQAAAALDRIVGGRDSLLVTLSDTAGRVIASAGRPLPASVPAIDVAAVAPAPGDDALAAVHVSPFINVGGRPMFWVVAPVVIDGVRAAYIAEPRWVVGAPNAIRELRELTREDLAVYSRNNDGSVWVLTPGDAVAPPTDIHTTPLGLSYERPGKGAFIAEEAPVPGTPWTIVLDSPVRTLLGRLRATVERLAWASLLLLAAGAALAWVMGRRITRPLVALTSAADQVATGTYERAMPNAGGDEIGRLTRRFHDMASQVTEARRELERRASDAQRVADELAAANRRLQTAMGEAESARTEAERARSESEAANRAKSDFLAMMSHELRTPLNAIAGYAELIELGIHGPVTDAQRDALNRIARSQAHLLTLINDVLNFARIDAGQMRYAVQDVRMHETLAGLEALVAPQVASRHQTFTYEPCDPEIVAAADADKVRQVVLNLLSNAVKYTPEGGSVRLACDADATAVRVHVTDTGPGIDPEQLPVIFEPFVQGHRALNRPNEGVGLGLAISRDLARGMGGDVTVTTQIAVGSRFTLELRRAGPALPPRRGQVPAEMSGAGSPATM